MKPNSYYLLKLIREKKFTKNQFQKDLIAGMIVAIIALPLSVGLAISSGVSPEKGLITAIVCGLTVALFGGNCIQINGPTATYVTLETFGIGGVFFATLLAGIFLIIAGLCRAGNIIKYIPDTVITGFTGGIGFILLMGQLKELLGMNFAGLPTAFIEKMITYLAHLNTLNWLVTLVGLASVFLILVLPKFTTKIPPYLGALILGIILTLIFKLPIPTIGSQFGTLSLANTSLSLPKVTFNEMLHLISPAFTIAILIGMESLLSSVVADEMIDEKHHPNMELIGQGLGNILTALCGGIPGAGVMARTATNARNGGRTAFSGIVHALGLLLIVVVCMPLIKYVPLTVLSAILVVVAYQMINFPKIITLVLRDLQSSIEVILTLFFTLVMDVVMAIVIAMVIHLILTFLKEHASVFGSMSSNKEELEG
jgi:SulP family sulfate permease